MNKELILWLFMFLYLKKILKIVTTFNQKIVNKLMIYNLIVDILNDGK